MLKKAITTAALAAFVVLLAITTAPVKADIDVFFGAGELDFNYDFTGNPAGEKYLVIRSTSETLMRMWLVDTDTSTITDGAELGATDTNTFVFELLLTQNGTNDWSASGTMTIDDSSGGVVEATFVSSSIATTGGFGNYFLMTGLLTTKSPNTAILEASSPWTFVGDADYQTGGGTGSDGEPSQITVANWESYDNGTMVTTQFLLTGSMSEDTLLGSDRALDGGWASGTIVPVPAAVVLGLIGLGLVGWRMRRYA